MYILRVLLASCADPGFAGDTSLPGDFCKGVALVATGSFLLSLLK